MCWIDRIGDFMCNQIVSVRADTFTARSRCPSGFLRERRRPAGFTLIELLIVISIVSLLVTLSIPAIEGVIESSRRTVCSSRLRQLGVALLNYHSTHDCYPPAILWAPPGIVLKENQYLAPGGVDLSAEGQNWQQDRYRAGNLLLLLPYLDASRVHDLWNTDQPVSSPANATVRGTRIEGYLCPSNASGVKNNCSLQGGNWARGNYAMNAGPNALCLQTPIPEFVKTGLEVRCSVLFPDIPSVVGLEVRPLDPKKFNESWGSGVGGLNRSFSAVDIRDGTSKTVAFEEVRGGLNPLDRRGTWAMPCIGSSVTFAHGPYNRTATGPNDIWSPDVIQDGDRAASVDARRMFRMRMPISGSEMSVAATSRSEHPGGVNVLMADGSIQFISDEVDLQIWAAQHTRDEHDD